MNVESNPSGWAKTKGKENIVIIAMNAQNMFIITESIL